MKNKMKAAIYTGPGQLSFEEVDIPTIGDGDILVRVKAALTCGTDLKTFKRGHPLITPPTLFGHEFAGEVAQVGEKVVGFEEGTRVVAANSAPCNTCFYCKRGQHNLCQNLVFNWGAFAEYIRVPENIVRQNTHRIPDNLSFQEAALLEPLACVVHGNELAGIALGDSVAIVGSGGPIGLMHLQLAIYHGAAQVIAIDIKDQRLGLARQLGATQIINPEREDPVAKVKELTEGRGADVVIECAGVPQTWETALQLVRKGGRVIWFGGCPSGTTISLNTGRVHYDELTLKGVFHHTPRTVERALSLLSAGVIKAKPLITGQLPLERLIEGLQMMMEGRCIKMAIIP